MRMQQRLRVRALAARSGACGASPGSLRGMRRFAGRRAGARTRRARACARSTSARYAVSAALRSQSTARTASASSSISASCRAARALSKLKLQLEYRV